jgi:hypothetical protein
VRNTKNGPSREGPICLGSLWLGESGADALVRGRRLAILRKVPEESSWGAVDWWDVD